MRVSKVIIVNNFFKQGIKADIESVLNQIILTDRQKYIVKAYYFEGKSVTYIADNLCVCPLVINKDIAQIRDKIFKIIN